MIRNPSPPRSPQLDAFIDPPQGVQGEWPGLRDTGLREALDPLACKPARVQITHTILFVLGAAIVLVHIRWRPAPYGLVSLALFICSAGACCNNTIH